MMAKEAGPILKTMSLQESQVVAFGALLDATHGTLNVTLVQFCRLDADEQGVAALRQQLAQFVRNGSGESRFQRALCIRLHACHFKHEGEAGGKGDGEVRAADAFRHLRLVRHAEGAFAQKQIGGFEFQLQIEEIFLRRRCPDLLADFVLEGGGKGNEAARRGQPRRHGLSQAVRPAIKEIGEQVVSGHG